MQKRVPWLWLIVFFGPSRRKPGPTSATGTGLRRYGNRSVDFYQSRQQAHKSGRSWGLYNSGKTIGWIWLTFFFVLLAPADAQTPAVATPNTKYDSTYAFVSSAKVNETYTTLGTERLRRCGDLWNGPLTISNGHARYNKQEGTVGPQGELTMRLEPTPLGRGGGNEGIEITTFGRIDTNGAVRARQTGPNCQYDVIWQKMPSRPFPTPSNRFDGAYAFFSVTNVNEWTDPAHTRRCGHMRNAGPLVIEKGQANFTTAKGQLVGGTIGQQGDMAMRYPVDPEVPGYVRPVIGRIDTNGTARARQIGNWCSHDFVWRREPK